VADTLAGPALLDALSSAGLALGAALSVLLLVLAVDHWRVRQRASDRLARFGLVAADEGPGATAAGRAGAAVLRRLGAGLAARAPRARLQQVHDALLRAGLADRLSAEEFLGLRVAAALAGMVAGLFLVSLARLLLGGAAGLGAGLVGLVVMAVGGALGYLAPPLVLARFARQRRAAIERLLPNAADVLVVSLEAGLGFDSIVAFLAERADNPLTVELRRYLTDLRLGRSRREALEALVDRTQSPGLGELASAVILADELGTGLARTLRSQAGSLRAMQRLRAEELARKAPVKLLFPIVLCIMPVLFIVIIGPAVLQALSLFGS
jgi:tight adherence protein C